MGTRFCLFLKRTQQTLPKFNTTIVYNVFLTGHDIHAYMHAHVQTQLYYRCLYDVMYCSSTLKLIAHTHTHTHTHSPLMSLDTTIHLTVKQKGRLGEQFIGHIPIPLRNFSITAKQITHWYKLGSRPGKIKNKLRGDLQVSIRLATSIYTCIKREGEHPAPLYSCVITSGA